MLEQNKTEIFLGLKEQYGGVYNTYRNESIHIMHASSADELWLDMRVVRRCHYTKTKSNIDIHHHAMPAFCTRLAVWRRCHHPIAKSNTDIHHHYAMPAFCTRLAVWFCWCSGHGRILGHNLF